MINNLYLVLRLGSLKLSQLQHFVFELYISPLYADINVLPPILIHAAGDDTLVDDSTRLYEKWTGNGIDIRLEPWDDLWHVWHYFGAHTPEAQEAIERIGKFVRDRLGLV